MQFGRRTSCSAVLSPRSTGDADKAKSLPQATWTSPRLSLLPLCRLSASSLMFLCSKTAVSRAICCCGFRPFHLKSGLWCLSGDLPLSGWLPGTVKVVLIWPPSVSFACLLEVHLLTAEYTDVEQRQGRRGWKLFRVKEEKLIDNYAFGYWAQQVCCISTVFTWSVHFKVKKQTNKQSLCVVCVCFN